MLLGAHTPNYVRNYHLPSSLFPPPPPPPSSTSPTDLRNAQDAQVILEAVRLGILPLIKRRLTAIEREQLQSGNVFVWEETEDEGLYRWTDGRRWSQSRMRGDYLFYEEKVQTTQEERDRKAARRAIRAMNPNVALPPTKRKDRPTQPNGLTKQTYSAVVRPAVGSNKSRKWHVVAYFQGNDYLNFPVVDDFEVLRRLTVPSNTFFGSKTSPSKFDRESAPSSEEDSSAYDSYSYPPSPVSSITAPVSTNPSSPLTARPEKYLRLPTDTPFLQRQELDLPPLASLPQRPEFNSSPASGGYIPLCSEDRRALARLRVVL